MSKFTGLKIGLLALQGDYLNHLHQIKLVGAEGVEIRLPEQLNDLDGLIIPGGESTTMNILLDRFNLREPLLEFGRLKPVWGTCAGMILLAKNIEDNQSDVTSLGLIDIDVVRNGYGRQIFSFEENLQAQLNGQPESFKASFIRAPRVTRTGTKVKKLAVYNGDAVLVEENKIMASSFHTELENDTRLLEYFLRKCLPVN